MTAFAAPTRRFPSCPKSQRNDHPRTARRTPRGTDWWLLPETDNAPEASIEEFLDRIDRGERIRGQLL